ncbi:MAG: AI-2E family transporter, partial [Rhodanobacteraceae bacterium]|nr:AI-2E family transporter [Rhodanobacteraceae bacterium]
MTPAAWTGPRIIAPWSVATDAEPTNPAPPASAPAPEDALAAIRRLLIAMLILAALYSVCLARPVLVPILMAAFLAICLRPLVDLGERLLPRLPAAVGVLALVLCAVGFALSLLTAPAQEWLRHAPDTLPHALAKLRAWLRLLGEASGTAPVLETVGTLSGAPADAPAPWRWWELLLAAPPLLVQAFSVILLTLFFAAYGGSLFRRVVELSPTLTSKKQLVGIVRAIEADT